MSDSPENKCPGGDACPYCSPQVPNRDGPGCVNHGVPDGYWCDHPGCPGTQNPRTFIGGSGRINTSGGGKTDEELARVTRAAVKGPDGYDYHWCPGVGWCPGCPPSAVPKEEA